MLLFFWKNITCSSKTVLWDFLYLALLWSSVLVCKIIDCQNISLLIKLRGCRENFELLIDVTEVSIIMITQFCKQISIKINNFLWSCVLFTTKHYFFRIFVHCKNVENLNLGDKIPKSLMIWLDFQILIWIILYMNYNLKKIIHVNFLNHILYDFIPSFQSEHSASAPPLSKLFNNWFISLNDI